MDRMFLDAAALRLIAQDLIARRCVPADQLAGLGTAYVALDIEVQELRERAARQGRKADAPRTEEGQLVADARAALAKVWGKACSIDALAKHLGVNRVVLSRCNGTNPIALSPAVRGQLRALVPGPSPST